VPLALNELRGDIIMYVGRKGGELQADRNLVNSRPQEACASIESGKGRNKQCIGKTATLRHCNPGLLSINRERLFWSRAVCQLQPEDGVEFVQHTGERCKTLGLAWCPRMESLEATPRPTTRPKSTPVMSSHCWPSNPRTPAGWAPAGSKCNTTLRAGQPCHDLASRGADSGTT
jgi:hypothetical protein